MCKHTSDVKSGAYLPSRALTARTFANSLSVDHLNEDSAAVFQNSQHTLVKHGENEVASNRLPGQNGGANWGVLGR